MSVGSLVVARRPVAAGLLALVSLAALGPSTAAAAPVTDLPLLGLVHTVVANRIRIRLDDLAQGAGTVSFENARLEFPKESAYDVTEFSVGAIRHAAPEPWFAPLWLRARRHPQGEGWRLTGTLATGRSQLVARLRVTADKTGGEMRIESNRVRLGPDGVEMRALSPHLALILEKVAGEVALSGRLGWGDRAGEAAEILVEDLGFTSDIGTIAGLTGVVTLDGLVPPRTPPNQRLAVALLDIGLPLARGELTAQLAGSALEVDRLAFEWAGGKLETGSFTLGIAPLAGAFDLGVRGLELSELLDQVEVDGLSGEGTIDGVLPLEIANGSEVLVRDGRLAARGPGVIRYRPASPPAALAGQGASVGLVLDALENFHFTDLAATLDGRTKGDMQIGLRLKGANPDLYEGHAVDFNLNLEGKLALILQSGIRSYQLPADIARRLQEFVR